MNISFNFRTDNILQEYLFADPRSNHTGQE
jgi:hypothetical protein